MTSIIEYNGPKNKFRNSIGQRLLGALFYEYNQRNPDQILYSVKRYDVVKPNVTYPSLFKLYMEMEDLTEYKFATTYFEDWEHWQMVANTFFLKPYISKWRIELDLKVRSEALQKIRSEAKDQDSKNKFAANKILIDRSWESKEEKKGRPTKAQIEARAKDIAQEDAQLQEDLKRILGE